jgi:hypothetical protein
MDILIFLPFCYTHFISSNSCYAESVESNQGSATNRIVIPLPSGVTTAPKIVIIMIAYLKFSCQNFESVKLLREVHTL